MYLRGMSDWNSVELEDSYWGDYAKGDDHIVPHEDDELLGESSAPSDSYRGQHDVKNDVKKVMCSRASGTRTTLWGEQDAYLSPMKNGCRFLDYCGNEYTDANSSMFCSEDLSLETRASAIDRTFCISSFDGVSTEVTDLSFLESEERCRDVDLAYYDWPDISNFEDIDKMFRNWDSIVEQEQTSTVDELSWFSSSSNSIYGSEIAFESGFQSSSSDLVALHAKLESYCPNANFLSDSVPGTVEHDKPISSNNADCLGTDAPCEGKSEYKPKSCNVGDIVSNTGLVHVGNEYSSSQSSTSDVKIKNQQSLEDRAKQSTDRMLLESDVLPPPRLCSQQRPQKKQYAGPSSELHNLDSQSQMECDQVLFAQKCSSSEFVTNTNTSSSSEVSDHIGDHRSQCLEKSPDPLSASQVMELEENTQKPYKGPQLCSIGTTKHLNQQSDLHGKASVQKQLLAARDDTQMENVGIEPPMVEVDHQITTGSTGMTSVSLDDISEKVNGFRQIQDVMHQLDVSTKLCIRDSLYRLARSARQRHSFTIPKLSEGTSGTKIMQGTEASNISVDFMDAEPHTNPIDRSIAHLLFHRPSEHPTRTADYTRSVESHIMNEQFHVPVDDPVLKHDQSDHQRTFGGCSDGD